MAAKAWTVPLGALVACGLSACGGGGGGGGGVPPGEELPSSYLFLTSSGADGTSLKAVDPSSPGAALEIVPARDHSTINRVQLLTIGTWGGKSGSITHAYTRALVFTESMGSAQHLYAVDARVGSSAPAAVQVGSWVDNSGSNFTNMAVYPDYARPENSLVVLDTMGYLTTVLPLSAPSTDAGHSLSWIEVLGVVRDESTGAITNLLGSRDGKFLSETPDLSTETILGDTSAALVLVEWAGKTWVRVGSKLYYVTPGATALTSPGGADVPFDSSTRWTFDERRLYFVDGSTTAYTVYAVPLDGSSGPTPVYTPAAPSRLVTSLAVSSERVVIDHGYRQWESVPKSGGTPAPLQAGGTCALNGVAGSSLFFMCADIAGTGWVSNLVAMNEDGTDRVAHDKSPMNVDLNWAFVGSDAFPIGAAPRASPRYALLAQPEAGDGVRSVSSYDALTREHLADLGTVEAGTTLDVLLEGSAGTTLLQVEGANGRDTYSLDATRAGSLLPVAVDPTASEGPAGTLKILVGYVD